MPADVITIVRRELENKHVSFAELARRLNISRSSITGSMKLHNMSVNRLKEISNIYSIISLGKSPLTLFTPNPPIEKKKS